jgi:hypothetical protein
MMPARWRGPDAARAAAKRAAQIGIFFQPIENWQPSAPC